MALGNQDNIESIKELLKLESNCQSAFRNAISCWHELKLGGIEEKFQPNHDTLFNALDELVGYCRNFLPCFEPIVNQERTLEPFIRGLFLSEQPTETLVRLIDTRFKILAIVDFLQQPSSNSNFERNLSSLETMCMQFDGVFAPASIETMKQVLGDENQKLLHESISHCFQTPVRYKLVIGAMKAQYCDELRKVVQSGELEGQHIDLKFNIDEEVDDCLVSVVNRLAELNRKLPVPQAPQHHAIDEAALSNAQNPVRELDSSSFSSVGAILRTQSSQLNTRSSSLPGIMYSRVASMFGNRDSSRPPALEDGSTDQQSLEEKSTSRSTSGKAAR